MQGVCAIGISKAGFSFAQDFQYDAAAETPDFLIPSGDAPRFMIEVHHAGSRDSFRMKIVRSFTAITEAKAFFGDNLISVNIFFGNPREELPTANLDSMCNFFDQNIFPLEEAGKPYASVEHLALELAAKEEFTIKTAVEHIVRTNPGGIVSMAAVLSKCLKAAKVRKNLSPLWECERKRSEKLKHPPTSGGPTYFKRGVLASLLLDDATFQTLQQHGKPTDLDKTSQTLLISLGLATLTEELDGDNLEIAPQFESFLRHKDAVAFRALCTNQISAAPRVNAFFDDIRCKTRRDRMAEVFLSVVRGGEKSLLANVINNYLDDNYGELFHKRCWLLDLMPLALGRSHNYFNNMIIKHPDYQLGVGGIYPSVVVKSPKLGKDLGELRNFLALVCNLLWSDAVSQKTDFSSVSASDVADGLLKFRLDAVIKLKKLDAMLLIAAEICGRLGLSITKSQLPSIVSDFAGGKLAGRVEAFIISSPAGKNIVVKIVAVHDGHGDDKSKEWGARRFVTLYRLKESRICLSELQEGIFVLDGEWEDRDVARLHRSGWSHVVRLDDLETTLRSVFGITKDRSKLPARVMAIPLDDNEDFAIAAESSDETPKLKRKGGHG